MDDDTHPTPNPAEAPAKPGGLHQMSMSFSAEDDRILFRLSTTDHVECRLWFTRRFTRVLWKALRQGFEAAPEVSAHADPKVKDAMLAMQHHDALQTGDFSKKFDESGENKPVDEQPLLIIGGNCTPNKNGKGARLKFQSREGKEIAVTLNEELLHAFCHLLVQTSAKGEWDLNMVMGGANVFIPDDTGSVVH